MGDMQFAHTNNTYVIKIEPGEACLATLTAFCQEHNIVNAHFVGLGASKDISFGYYHLDTQAYEFHTYGDIAEVLNVTGNIFPKDGALFAHTHGTFGRADGTTFGGHVDEMICAVTMEIILTPLASTFTRTFDTATGLYLLDVS